MERNTPGGRIEAARKAAKLTQQQVADALHVKRETVNQWESNTRQIKSSALMGLADLLNVSIDYLLCRTEASTVDANIRAMCDYTRLSESAIAAAHTLSLLAGSSAYIDICNFLLEGALNDVAVDIDNWFADARISYWAEENITSLPVVDQLRYKHEVESRNANATKFTVSRDSVMIGDPKEDGSTEIHIKLPDMPFKIGEMILEPKEAKEWFLHQIQKTLSMTIDTFLEQHLAESVNSGIEVEITAHEDT